MLADQRGTVVSAQLIREIPAGSEELPSSALGAAGGGDVAVDASDARGRTATDRVFQIELALPEGTAVSGVGGRAYVRLDHGRESLWRQWARGLRQLLLSRLKV
jgi:putative peptide zinc metalloprotease protein